MWGNTGVTLCAGLQQLLVAGLLTCLEDHGAEHEQGDHEDDEHFPNHGLRHRHEAREFLDSWLIGH